jgi:two-component system KDP operon response regulator KdpE
MPHVLLVEDNPAILHILQAMMEYGGFTSTQAATANEALGCLAREPFDAILLDLGLPDIAGSHLIESIRAASPNVPLIVVSGQSEEMTKIAALDAGADDFVQKPFMPGELIARVRAMLRHSSTEPVRRAIAAPHAWTKPPKRSRMISKLIDVLRSRDGELVTNAEIIESLWGNKGVERDRNLRVLVSNARQQLQAERSVYQIVNAHGRGYRLIHPKGPLPIWGSGDRG